MRPGTLLTVTACFVALALGAKPAYAQSVELTQFPASGETFSTPFYVTAPPGDTSRVFVVEAAGAVRLVKGGVEQPTPFLDITGEVHLPCECGMFSIAFPPDYASSGLVYATYTRDVDPGTHELVLEEFRRSSANPDVTDPAGQRQVLVIAHPNQDNHNGGQLQFGPDGYLYWSVGDGGGAPNLAQDLTSRLGKLLRIDPRGPAPGQYSIPPDNPFADGPGGNADEVYSYGLRNPYRFSFDRGSGDLTIGDVGGGELEEIDYKPEGTARGANFGWPCFEGTQVHITSGPCSPPPSNHSPPVHQYQNPAAGPAAVMGGYVIRDRALPSLFGRYVYTDTYGAVPGIRAIDLFTGASSGDASLGFSAMSPVSFGQDACNHVYVTSQGGVVSRLQPSSGPFPCTLALGLSAETRNAAKARRQGGVPAMIRCDEDCAVTVSGSILIARGRDGKGPAKVLKASPVSTQVDHRATASLVLDLSKRQLKRLGKALGNDDRIRTRIEVTGTGETGGTGSAQDRRPRKQRKRKKKG